MAIFISYLHRAHYFKTSKNTQNKKILGKKVCWLQFHIQPPDVIRSPNITRFHLLGEIMLRYLPVIYLCTGWLRGFSVPNVQLPGENNIKQNSASEKDHSGIFEM